MPQNQQSFQSERFERIAARIFVNWPADQWTNSDLIVAVSGGPDSVALFCILWHLIRIADGKGTITIVHCNHHTRAQSDSDAVFVRDLAQHYQVEYRQCDRTTDSRDGDLVGYSEESLRDFRYQALLSVGCELGIRYIATGHSADDQIETVLFRLLRGTGLGGLQGIPHLRIAKGVSIVRPLLTTRRAEIIELLNEWEQPFCLDDSNNDNSYTRNFLRNEIIPKLADRFGKQFDNSILKLSRQASDQVELLDQLTDQLVRNFEIDSERTVSIDRAKVRELHPLLIRHALNRIWGIAQFPQQGMNREKWMLLSSLITSTEPRSLQLPGNVSAIVTGNRLILERS